MERDDDPKIRHPAPGDLDPAEPGSNFEKHFRALKTPCNSNVLSFAVATSFTPPPSSGLRRPKTCTCREFGSTEFHCGERKRMLADCRAAGSDE
jgi:hypothetical protein